MTVGLWRRRFVKQGLTGLHEELRSGRPRSIPDERVATLIRRTLRNKPKDGTHWSCRSLAAETRLSKSTVHRIWRAFGLQPHRARHFQLSNDPFFAEKVRDIVRLGRYSAQGRAHARYYLRSPCAWHLAEAFLLLI